MDGSLKTHSDWGCVCLEVRVRMNEDLKALPPISETGEAFILGLLIFGEKSTSLDSKKMLRFSVGVSN